MKIKADSKVYIYGKHALGEALKHRPDSIKKVFLSSEVQKDSAFMDVVRASAVSVSSLGSDKDVRDVAEEASHQGAIGVLAVETLVRPYDAFIKSVPVTADTALVVLGEVQDPHNVGAIIRSAAAFGIGGVLIPEHNQAPVTGAVVKVSAGMAFTVPLVAIGNVNTTLRDLKERGFWIYGLAGEGTQSLHEEAFDAPTVFVVGNEAEGLREKTKEACDIVLSIPIHPQCESLNAAAATTVVLYDWSKKHKEALRKT